MARSRSKPGSGILAGLIVAALGFVFFARYMTSSHVISYDDPAGPPDLTGLFTRPPADLIFGWDS